MDVEKCERIPLLARQWQGFTYIAFFKHRYRSLLKKHCIAVKAMFSKIYRYRYRFF